MTGNKYQQYALRTSSHGSNGDMVLNGVTVRGSIVGTRLDLQESLEFAEQGKVAATVATDRLENINQIFEKMHKGQIEGRIVLDLAA